MPYQPLNFQPGIRRLSTEYSNEGAYFEANRVRFRDGKPEPIGGWTSQELIGELYGICRSKHTWLSNSGLVLEAFGTTEGLWVNLDGTLYDITPVRQQFASAADPLSVTSGSTTLTISASTHGASVGERVELVGFDLTAQGVSLSDLNATHFVVSVPDANSVTVELPSPATGTVSGGGGTGDINFLLSPGAEGTVFGDGWGAGAYGFQTYGTPRNTLVEANRARVWSLDNWGEILVATYRGGTPVKWDPTNDSVNVRASAIPNCPKADFLLVSSPDRHLVLLGSVLPGDTEINRLCVRWCDQEDYTEWNITATTTAGYQLLSNGSEILAGQQTSRQIMIWTDTVVAAMQYIGPPFTFGFQPLDATSAITSRNAAVEVDGTVMWLGVDSFYVFDGIARVLPCPIKDIVFDDYNLAQKEKFFGVVNQKFHEVWWFFVSAGASEIDRYVSFDYVNQLWSYGQLSRTAWEDTALRDYPTAIDSNNDYYLHENGTSADGDPLGEYVESAPFDIGEGDYMMLVKGIVPDIKTTTDAGMEILIKSRRYPQSAEMTHGPYTITPTTERVRTRIRARQISFRYQGTGTDSDWQGGTPRIDLKPQGRY